MERLDWIMWAVTETVKYIIISCGILGVEFRRGKIKYVVYVYPIICILFCQCFKENMIYIRTFWILLFMEGIFKGKFVKKFQIFLFEYILVSLVDWLVWIVLEWNTGWKLAEEGYVIDWAAGILGMFIWLALSVFLKRYREEIQTEIETISLKYYLLLIFVLMGAMGIAGLAQGSVMGKLDAYGRAADLVFLFFSGMLVFLLLLFILLFFIILSKKRQLEMMNGLAQKCLDYQKDYYEKVIEKDEEMRRFRHDIRKHMNVLAVLSGEGRMEEIQEYIGELRHDFSDMLLQYTGNSIADYFVNDVVTVLKDRKGAEYSIIGRFPENMRVKPEDFCVLWGNAMDNAKAALLKYEGNPRLDIVIKNYKGRLFVQITNSADERKTGRLEGDRKDKEHGYGLKNMAVVVDKYGGEMEWRYEKESFVLRIEI